MPAPAPSTIRATFCPTVALLDGQNLEVVGEEARDGALAQEEQADRYAAPSNPTKAPSKMKGQR